MFKRRRKPNVSLAIGTGVCILAIGVGAPYIKDIDFGQSENQLKQVDTQNTESEVMRLAQLPIPARASQLEVLAQEGKSRDKSRARYLLASDAIAQQQGEKALQWLEGLEKDYSLLSGHIALKRAQAYQLTGDSAKAREAYQDILKRYEKEPVAAEALYALGQQEPTYWEQAIEEFPAHPRTIEIASRRLQQNPKQTDLLMLTAKHGLYHPDIASVLDRLEKSGKQFEPEEWEAIAFGYWEKQLYGKAGAAYAKAPPTPRNLYRAGRGLQLGNKIEAARDAYKKLVQEFPEAKETGTGLLRLQELVTEKEAISYLNQAIEKFPDKAPEAVLAKSKLLESRRSIKAAEETRQLLLTKHSKSEAAAKLRWSIAEQKAAARELKSAWEWAEQIVKENPDSDLAAEAAFWVGKWAQTLGNQQEAQKAFEHLLAKYPESYYAWRAAVFLGWDVGDFTTVRQHSPVVLRPEKRPTPPAGSEALKELYQLGQDRDAWSLWQVEFKNLMQPTVGEQFTDGLMRLAIGDNLEGIFMVSHLAQREVPEERSQYEILKKQSAYWHALYPFPYLESILNWSKENKLNPVLVTALIRQESRFMPAIKSPVGAIGLMQVMPETASEIARSRGLKQYKLDNPDDNIQIGTAYLDFTHNQYNNNSLLAVASYNAGPGSVADWLAKYSFSDPDAFVEKIPFSETKGYVQGVFGNYWNYLRLYNPEIGQKLAQHAAGQSTASRR